MLYYKIKIREYHITSKFHLQFYSYAYFPLKEKINNMVLFYLLNQLIAYFLIL